MSSFKNASKSNQKTHRERGQVSSRAHLGLLEKKKDYKRRAEDYQKKQKTLKVLKRKALDKNPDEFYFKMVKTKMEDGVHQAEDTNPQYTDQQLLMMQSQDLKYVNLKRNVELKKIDKMKGSLHMLDVADKPKNKHIIFVDNKREARELDIAKHLDTHPELIHRTYNRPRKDQLKTGDIGGKLDTYMVQEIAQERQKQYKELGKRIEREQQLNIIAQKMETKRHLMDKQSKRKKVHDETTASAAVYKWTPQRKK